MEFQKAAKRKGKSRLRAVLKSSKWKHLIFVVAPNMAQTPRGRAGAGAGRCRQFPKPFYGDRFHRRRRRRSLHVFAPHARRRQVAAAEAAAQREERETKSLFFFFVAAAAADHLSGRKEYIEKSAEGGDEGKKSRALRHKSLRGGGKFVQFEISSPLLFLARSGSPTSPSRSPAAALTQKQTSRLLSRIADFPSEMFRTGTLSYSYLNILYMFPYMSNGMYSESCSMQSRGPHVKCYTA